MKNIACYHTHAEHPEEAIEDFNNRNEDLGIASEKDVISVSVLPAVTDIKVHNPKGPAKKSLYEIVCVYWTTHKAR